MDARSRSRREVLAWGLGLAGSRLAPPRLLAAYPEDPIAALPAHVWANARQNGLVMVRHPAPPDLSPIARITAPAEAGAPLVVSGRVVAPDGRTPASGVTVYAYNTDADGYYGDHRTDFPPRICGWMVTDSSGCFELHTIRPGRYPGMHVPAHVHFVLWGGGYPPQWVDDLRFAGDSYLTDADLETSRARGFFRTVQPIERRPDGSWRTEFVIRLAAESNANWR